MANFLQDTYIVLLCQSCNVKKTNDCDMLLIAEDKLEKNEKMNFVREKKTEESQAKTTEIDINQTNYAITRKYLEETIATDGYVLFSNALNSCTYLCKDKTGHGSQQTIRNYIAVLTSDVAPFMIIKNDEKKKIIVKRDKN